jgi:hypothetical protein
MAPQTPDSAPGQSKDDLQRLLREALKKKRPRRLRLALAAIVVILGLTAGAGWLLYSGGEPPPLTVVAFDDVDVAGKETTLRGRLEAPPETRVHLAGRDMVFVDGRVLPAPGQTAKEVRAKTDRDGATSCQWTFAADETQGDYILRYVSDKFRPGMDDRGQVLLIPKAKPLCLVQINDTLTRSAVPAWQQDNIQDIVPVPEAAEALQQIREQGYEIVYLALAANRPTLYQKMRGWINHWSAAGTPPLPAGVVLSRFTLSGADQDRRPWQQTAELLKKKFVPKADDKLQHAAIVGTIDAAQQIHAAGVRTLYLGAGEDLPGTVQRVASWEDVKRLLEK